MDTARTVPSIEGFGYVVLNVPDLDRSIAFYRRIGHLQVVDRSTSSAFLTGGFEHHWVKLEQSNGPVGLKRLGFRMSSDHALAEVTERLDVRNIAVEEFGDLHGDGIDQGIRFTAIDGVEIDLYRTMVSLPTKPLGELVRMDRALHGVWLVQDPQEAHEFYEGVLGFRASDWIEDVGVFMHAANRYHHSMGILKAQKDRVGSLDHFCILVPEIDDVLRARNIALNDGVRLRQDLVRHAASGSISTYIEDEELGIQVEFCVDHCMIDDPNHRPRILEASPVTVNLWLAGTDQDPHRRLQEAAATPDLVPVSDFANLVA